MTPDQPHAGTGPDRPQAGGGPDRPHAGADPQPPSAPGSELPLRPRWARAVVLLSVFVCAACGLVYELALVAFGSYLFGNSVVQASIVLSVMVFAMGVGSLGVKPLQRYSALTFAAVEGLLALIGGLSVTALYAAFAWYGLYRPALVLIAFAVGALIGAEIPLLMTLIQRIRRQEAGSAAADLFAADYVGALLGGLTFPFVLLPLFGQIRGVLVVAALNATAGMLVVLWLFRSQLRPRLRRSLWAGMAVVLAVLAGMFALSGRFEVSARQALFADPIVHAERSPYQQIVLTRQGGTTGGPADLRLFLDGDLQFSSADEYRYHESLVHPVMAGPHESVLVLGGGDGLALREILRYPGVRRAVVVELDPAVLRLAREFGPLARLNRDALADPRVETRAADAFTWLQENTRRFDVIIADLPDPDAVATAKLYSVEFYALARQALAPGGRMVVQAGSPYFAPKPFWCVESSLRAAGLDTRPYRVTVPSFGTWGFFLAAREEPELTLPEGAPELRYLDRRVLRAATVFPDDRSRLDLPASTIDQPRILRYEQQSWRNY